MAASRALETGAKPDLRAPGQVAAASSEEEKYRANRLPLSSNSADSVLHVVIAIVALYLGFGMKPAATPTT